MRNGKKSEAQKQCGVRKTWDLGLPSADYDFIRGMNKNFKADAIDPKKDQITEPHYGSAFDHFNKHGLKYGYQPCPHCNGKGSNLRYPYYSTIMPEQTNIPCEHCRGEGQLYVVPNDAVIIRENDFKR